MGSDSILGEIRGMLRSTEGRYTLAYCNSDTGFFEAARLGGTDSFETAERAAEHLLDSYPSVRVMMGGQIVLQLNQPTSSDKLK